MRVSALAFWRAKPAQPPGPASSRLHDVLRRHDIKGEMAIAAAQAGISSFVLLLHLLAQISHHWESFNLWVVVALGGLMASSLMRYCLVRGDRLPHNGLELLNILDVALFLSLIWSYQFAYHHPAGGVLKAPSSALLFVLIGLRALRFDPRPILIVGSTAVVGWVALTLLAIERDGAGAITRSYPDFLTSYGILLGAEVERTVALAALTAFLAVATFMARRILSKAAHAEDYAAALEAAQSNLKAAKEAKKVAERTADALAERDAQLSEQNARFNIALDNMSQGLCLFDADERLVVCNRRYINLYGLPQKLAKPGTPFRDIIAHRVANGIYAGEDPQEYIEERLAAVHEGEASTKIQELTDGRVVAIAHRPMSAGGWVATHEDITELQRVQAQIAHMAHHDSLTELPNRLLLRERIEEALPLAARGESFAIMCLDLDRFKSVNDTLGHSVGDELLRAVARRLRHTVRETDTVSRLGGDEFAILQASDNQPDDATALAGRICEVLSKPFELADHRVVSGTSIGIAVAPADGVDADQLLKNADMALYRAKGDGRDLYRFFEPDMDARMQARRQLELDLRMALEASQFELYYQPLVNLASGEITGFEALLRWPHPTRGMVPPNEFIPLAEEIGTIVPLGEWVIRRACADAARWPANVRVAVNLSPAQFKSDELVPVVFSALANSRLAAGRLELEITENALLQDNTSTLKTLHELRDMGVRIAMDDFGTGYSSLSYLRSFPFDKIKIDGSFVKDLSHQEGASAIINAVASLSRSLGMTTTAEGVETEEQRLHVKAAGYTEMQGHLFSPALPVGQILHTFFPASERPATKSGESA